MPVIAEWRVEGGRDSEKYFLSSCAFLLLLDMKFEDFDNLTNIKMSLEHKWLYRGTTAFIMLDRCSCEAH